MSRAFGWCAAHARMLVSRYEKCSTIIISNRPFEDRAKLLGDVLVITPLSTVSYTTAICLNSMARAGG